MILVKFNKIEVSKSDLTQVKYNLNQEKKMQRNKNNNSCLENSRYTRAAKKPRILKKP